MKNEFEKLSQQNDATANKNQTLSSLLKTPLYNGQIQKDGNNVFIIM